jgi:hypothetical protein
MHVVRTSVQCWARRDPPTLGGTRRASWSLLLVTVLSALVLSMRGHLESQ